MTIFFTSSAKHFESNLKLRKGLYTIKKFKDGEIFVRVDQDVKNQQVWVLTATEAPAENLLELFFLLDALERSGAHINLFITYFGYARQVITQEGEACSAQVICNILNNFKIAKTYILHPHSILLNNFLKFTAIQDTDFFCQEAKDCDSIAAPDKGVSKLAKEIAQICNKELILLNKERINDETVKITAIEGNITNKRVLLVDDIISTGHTLLEAAHTLKNLGALSVSAAATHGVFSSDCTKLLDQNILKKISVTNSIAQIYHNKINVIDITNFIQKIITQN